jgi:hypothetical protein
MLLGAALFSSRLGLSPSQWVGPVLVLSSLWLLAAALLAGLRRQLARTQTAAGGGRGRDGGGEGGSKAAGAGAGPSDAPTEGP